MCRCPRLNELCGEGVSSWDPSPRFGVLWVPKLLPMTHSQKLENPKRFLEFQNIASHELVDSLKI